MEELKYPVRINKYLAIQKICSRREADFLINQNKIRINGKIAVLGDKVNEKDKVTVENFKKEMIYLAFNKPVGVLTYSPDKKELEIANVIKTSAKVFPIGRLDKDSSGLIILTNDGRVTDRLLNPESEHEKEYVVELNKTIEHDFIKRMSNGVRLDDGYITKKCQIEQAGKKSFKIILTEGKKRQIRRMCGSLGYGVMSLRRIRIMNIGIGNLLPGQFRTIKGKELETFLKALAL